MTTIVITEVNGETHTFDGFFDEEGMGAMFNDEQEQLFVDFDRREVCYTSQDDEETVYKFVKLEAY